MAAKTKITVLMLLVMFPILIAGINVKAFFAVTSILMLYFSLRALLELVIVNFASDSVYEKYQTAKDGASLGRMDLFLVCATYGIFLIMLLMLLLSLSGAVMKAFAAALLILWSFDLWKVLSKPDEDADWSIMDTVKEVAMWAQSIGSIVFIASIAFML